MQFCKFFFYNLWLINGHFLTISGLNFANYMNIFHKAEIQTVILRCIVFLYHNWIKSNDIISVNYYFFHSRKCIISGLVCRSQFWHCLRKSALIFSKRLFFQNTLRLSWPTKSGKMQVKRWNCFLIFSLKNFWRYFCQIHFWSEFSFVSWTFTFLKLQLCTSPNVS